MRCEQQTQISHNERFDNHIIHKAITTDGNGYPVYRRPRIELNESQAARLQDKLLETLLNFLDSIHLDEKYWMVIKKSNRREPYSVQLTSEGVKKIIESLKDGTFFNAMLDDDIDPYSALLDSDPAEDPIANWYIIEEIMFQKAKTIDDSNKTLGGSFFPYFAINTSDAVKAELLKCQIFPAGTFDANKHILKDSCLVYALKQSKILPDNIIKELTYKLSDRFISAHSDLASILKDYDIRLNIKDMDIDEPNHVSRSRGLNKKLELQYEINVNLFKGHYFLEYKTGITSDYLEHMDDPKARPDCRFKNGYWMKDPTRCLTSSKLIKWLFEHKKFIPMTYAKFLSIPSIEPPKASKEIHLRYNYNQCVRRAKDLNKWNTSKDGDKKQQFQASGIWFADTEADTGIKLPTNYREYSEEEQQELIAQAIHRPYMLCLSNEDGTIKKTFKGISCILDFLEFIPDKAIVYFHNLKYDLSFIAKYGISGQAVRKGSTTYQCDIRYFKKQIRLRDSYCLIHAPLANFPKMFNLGTLEKEVFPYQYYTLSRLQNKYGEIEEAVNYLQNSDDADHFRKNALKYSKDGITFDMYAYCEYYCARDVDVLRAGFNKFRSDVLKDLQPDIAESLTAPSLAHKYFNREVYEHNPEIKALGGLPAEFIRNAIHGGRCMTALNKRWHTTMELFDFDAVSLYPSAMRLLKIPLGAPKVWEAGIDWKKQDCFIGLVEFQPVEKHYEFPLFCLKDEKKNTNKWTDTFTEPIQMFISHVYLQDLIDFYPNLQYKIIRGYYWNEGVDTHIQDVIKHVFERRLYYKNLKNPLQEIYKLIMNSSYGKTIQKFIDSETVYIHKDDYDRYVWKNYNTIIYTEPLTDSNIVMVKKSKAINNQFAFVHVGVLILDWSKHIMNEVMCLAHDIGCQIFYQDTDSMHIRKEDEPKLIEAFKEKYNRELKGKGMGQFHNDFDGGDHAIESYFICPKVYIDKLDTGICHIRMKGVSKDSIEAKAKENGITVLELYELMYGGKTQTFNLSSTKPSFQFSNDMSIISFSMIRRLSSQLEEGNLEKYV